MLTYYLQGSYHAAVTYSSMYEWSGWCFGRLPNFIILLLKTLELIVTKIDSAYFGELYVINRIDKIINKNKPVIFSPSNQVVMDLSLSNRLIIATRLWLFLPNLSIPQSCVRNTSVSPLLPIICN